MGLGWGLWLGLGLGLGSVKALVRVRVRAHLPPADDVEARALAADGAHGEERCREG